MSAPTEPSATASEPRLPGRSSSWTRSRYEGTRNTLAQHRPVGTSGGSARPWHYGLALVSQISRDDVAHLARLARLALTDDELDSFSGQLDAILEHVSRIQAVDVTDVEPTGNPLKDVNVTRPDTVAPSLTQQRGAGRGAAGRRGPLRGPADPGGEPVS